eukprot:scaffold388_cov244-Pinguiococcus_pyrenoidosus.AAC.43
MLVLGVSVASLYFTAVLWHQLPKAPRLPPGVSHATPLGRSEVQALLRGLAERMERADDALGSAMEHFQEDLNASAEQERQMRAIAEQLEARGASAGSASGGGDRKVEKEGKIPTKNGPLEPSEAENGRNAAAAKDLGGKSEGFSQEVTAKMGPGTEEEEGELAAAAAAAGEIDGEAGGGADAAAPEGQVPPVGSAGKRVEEVEATAAILKAEAEEEGPQELQDPKLAASTGEQAEQAERAEPPQTSDGEGASPFSPVSPAAPEASPQEEQAAPLRTPAEQPPGTDAAPAAIGVEENPTETPPKTPKRSAVAPMLDASSVLVIIAHDRRTYLYRCLGAVAKHFPSGSTLRVVVSVDGDFPHMKEEFEVFTQQRSDVSAEYVTHDMTAAERGQNGYFALSAHFRKVRLPSSRGSRMRRTADSSSNCPPSPSLGAATGVQRSADAARDSSGGGSRNRLRLLRLVCRHGSAAGRGSAADGRVRLERQRHGELREGRGRGVSLGFLPRPGMDDAATHLAGAGRLVAGCLLGRLAERTGAAAR